MMIETSKFPVIAPDGTEYRVKIRECNEMFIGENIEASLYIPRKWVGYKKIYDKTYFGGMGKYDSSNLDLIYIATKLVHDYYSYKEWKKNREKQKVKQEEQRKSAVESFKNWDGKIAE